MAKHKSLWTAPALALTLISAAPVIVEVVVPPVVGAAEQSLSPEARLEIRKEQEQRLASQDETHAKKMEALAQQYQTAAKLAAQQGEDSNPLLAAAAYFQQQADKSSVANAQSADSFPSYVRHSHDTPTAVVPERSQPETSRPETSHQTSLQNLSNQVAAISIVIDSGREGWEQAVAYASDPAGDNGETGRTDWNVITLAHDCDDLYVRYEVDDGPAFKPDGHRYNLLLDVDKNPMTGYRGLGKWLAIGADVLIQGGPDKVTTLKYSGSADQEAWGWQPIDTYPVSDQAPAAGGRDIDYRIRISDLDVLGQGVSDFTWVAWADYATGSADFYPDNGNLGDAGDFNTYSFQYQPTTTALRNPERGFFKATRTQSSNYKPLDVATLQCYRQNEGINLIHRLFYLEDFVDSDISQQYLDLMQADFDRVRQAGLKVVLRFAYTAGPELTPPYGDASKARILSHLDQLTGILSNHSDVIAVMQAGFIGLWGEWWFSDHFQPDSDWNDRADVLFKMLDVLPASRTVQLRTPRYKQHIYNDATPLDLITAHDASDQARTGHHNDCFVSSQSDGGTYVNNASERAYLAAETKWTPMGGETCDPNFLADPQPQRLSCEAALNELSRLHGSFLNLDWYKPTLRQWRDAGCLSEIEDRLGYRLILEQGGYDDQVSPGGKFQYRLQLKNEGFSAPFNPRAVALILRHSEGATYRFALADDPRFWLPGETHTLTGAISIPDNFPAGEYELLLSLPAPEASLQQRPEYAMRLANDSIWEANTGYNRLNHKLIVQPPAYYPQAVEIKVGKYDWGNLTSFTADDKDTYDIKARPVTGGRATDWQAATRILVPPAKVSKLTLTYRGHYSRRKVDQAIYLYNYKSAGWDLIDTRIVGNTDDATVQVSLSAPQAYLAANGESRVRVRGFREKKHRFYAWANYLSWEVQ